MIYLIAAYSRNRIIGRNGRIPWSIKGEQRRFKELTTGNAVIMGRRTYEEIGKPLPDRFTIVVSGTRNYESEHCITVPSLQEAFSAAGNRDSFIAGGAALYRDALPYAQTMYITIIEKDIEGDTHFPDFDENDWSARVDACFDGEIPYTYVTYTRKTMLMI